MMLGPCVVTYIYNSMTTKKVKHHGQAQLVVGGSFLSNAELIQPVPAHLHLLQESALHKLCC